MEDAIRKDAKNLLNRLKSIKYDSEFVAHISDRFPHLKLVPNERCGLWYVHPSRRSQGCSVYFKSTDGHFGKWNLSMKRLNLHLLPIIAKDAGCIIVDSTRSGKRFPDSLSKTIPIWCCVINNALAIYRATNSNNKSLESLPWDVKFHSLASLVSKTEHDQIASQILKWANALLSSVDMASYSEMITKPLRPIWIAPDTRYFVNLIEDPSSNSVKRPLFEELDYFPVYCINASESSGNMVDSMGMKDFCYVQGAGDDHELWGQGLSPQIFWENEERLLSPQVSCNTECMVVLRAILSARRQNDDCVLVPNELSDLTHETLFNWIGNTNIAIGGRRAGKPPLCWTNFDVVINCGAIEYAEMVSTVPDISNDYLYLPIPEGKRGQHALYDAIPIALDWIQSVSLRKFPVSLPKILIHCMQGKERSVAIAISLLMTFGTADGAMDYRTRRKRETMSKKQIQDKLIEIQRYRHLASPSRAFMCRVNECFLGRE
ncbi:tRNA A64-2'-O-ribosylphosphate transferase [Chytriomyces cf. hyalinus JEL632]|nr:tRNA A64-2'-O-ribosylphosphate transferase [Chytriomyces cf. hyalinus JEL632]